MMDVPPGRTEGSSAATTIVDAEAGETAMLPLVPVMVAVAVSVAVMVWIPAVLRVTEKAFWPLSPPDPGIKV
jgi:hypothetical protein